MTQQAIASYNKVSGAHLTQLTAWLGPERVSNRAADLDLYARDQSFHHPSPPEVVVWPETTAEVSRILEFANQSHIPVTPWGVGTSLEGNPIPVHGGILMSFARMNRVLKIWPEDFQIDVQPGITRLEVNKALRSYGLFFAPDPGADATVGGMAANNSSGIKTVKYGAMKDNVMRLEVVKADGEVVRLGTRSRKDSSGYDLLHLFIGSEGTLGVITEVTLKLFPIPEHKIVFVAGFTSVEETMQTVVDVVGAALEPSALEFVDVETVRVLKADKGLTWLKDAPTLLIESSSADFEGVKATVQDICESNGALSFDAGFSPEDCTRLWEARHHAYESLLRFHPGEAQLIMDVAVPLSRYPEIVLYANSVLAEHNLLGYKLGHAGDGNLHINIIYTPDSAEQFARVEEVNGLIVERAIALEGTATGEHGVGIGKRSFIVQQHGAALGVMRQIKSLLDPNGILNPGKIFLDNS